MRMSEEGVHLLKVSEGAVRNGHMHVAYQDAVGYWTIGYGHLLRVGEPREALTNEQADRLLDADLERFEDAVEDLIEVELEQCEFDALVDFAFNMGRGALKSSTLRRRLNAGEDKQLVAEEELVRWVYAGGRRLGGLVKRREREVRMFCGEDWLD